MKDKKALLIWLGTIATLVYAMVLIGGITRITDSGLSMVEWRPVAGFLPPLDATEWNRVFDLYRQSPEYQHINKGMTLSEFKWIFFWEYLHRLLGRLVGIIYFIPLLIFHFRGSLKQTKWLSTKLWIGFFLGGSQGILGWYMVKSGLVDRPDVSHYRLAAHLSLALIIFVYIGWLWLSIARNTMSERFSKGPLLMPGLIFTVILAVQIVWGAFTAGLKAGYGFNTFPDMAGHFFPPGGLSIAPVWLNFLENHSAVQFTHRTLGWTLLGMGLILFVNSLREKVSFTDRMMVRFLLSLLVLQFGLGAAVLVLQIPMGLAVLHQSGAFFLLLATLLFMHHQFYAKKSP